MHDIMLNICLITFSHFFRAGLGLKCDSKAHYNSSACEIARSLLVTVGDNWILVSSSAGCSEILYGYGDGRCFQVNLTDNVICNFLHVILNSL